MLEISEGLLKSWTMLLKSHGPGAPWPSVGKATSLFKHDHLIIRFVCSKPPVRCNTELAAPCLPRAITSANHPIQGLLAPAQMLLGKLFPGNDSAQSPLIRDCSHTITPLISSLCYCAAMDHVPPTGRAVQALGTPPRAVTAGAGRVSCFTWPAPPETGCPLALFQHTSSPTTSLWMVTRRF